MLSDPRSTGFGLNLLAYIALVSDSPAEALEYSEQSLAVVVTPVDRLVAFGAKAFSLHFSFVEVRRVPHHSRRIAAIALLTVIFLDRQPARRFLASPKYFEER